MSNELSNELTLTKLNPAYFSVIDMPIDTLLKLLLDSSKAKTLNLNSLGREDIARIDDRTKIVWNKISIPLFGHHDFCTLMSVVPGVPKKAYKGASGVGKSFMLVSRAVEHKDVPHSDKFQRSRVILGVNVLKEVLVPAERKKGSKQKQKQKQTELLTINHFEYTKIPPALVARTSYNGVMNYLTNLKKVAFDMADESSFQQQ